MHLLVGIDDNVAEWRDALTSSPERPRLPLPYAFGAAFIQRGHRVSALRGGPPVACAAAATSPFEAIYGGGDLRRALGAVDLASLWGGDGVRAVLQGMLAAPRRVVLNAYAWRQRRAGLAARLAAPFARAVVVMTGEQADRARAALGARVPVILFRCGIDTAFYRGEVRGADRPEEHSALVSRLQDTPYALMMGDQLRLELDALQLVEHSSLTLVRVSQGADPAQRAWLREEIRRRRIEERFIVLDRISYPFLRLLLRHARAYAGLVDSSWQPAGWTALCEALAAGVPAVLYEGLVSRELSRLGAAARIVNSVAPRDLAGARTALEHFTGPVRRDPDVAREAAAFAAQVLDCERSAPAFVADLEGLR